MTVLISAQTVSKYSRTISAVITSAMLLLRALRRTRRTPLLTQRDRGGIIQGQGSRVDNHAIVPPRTLDGDALVQYVAQYSSGLPRQRIAPPPAAAHAHGKLGRLSHRQAVHYRL